MWILWLLAGVDWDLYILLQVCKDERAALKRLFRRVQVPKYKAYSDSYNADIQHTPHSIALDFEFEFHGYLPLESVGFKVSGRGSLAGELMSARAQSMWRTGLLIGR